jgi:hypothetical protein
MEINGDRKSIWMSLDISPLFFHIVTKLIQALVIIYDEIFQAPVVEGDILFQKPFLDLGFDGVVSWKSMVLEMFFSVFQT